MVRGGGGGGAKVTLVSFCLGASISNNASARSRHPNAAQTSGHALRPERAAKDATKEGKRRCMKNRERDERRRGRGVVEQRGSLG